MNERLRQAQDQLRAVNAAIRDALASGAQSVSLSVGGASQNVQRYSIAQLYDIRKELLREIALIQGRARRRVWRAYT